MRPVTEPAKEPVGDDLDAKRPAIGPVYGYVRTTFPFFSEIDNACSGFMFATK